MNLIDLSVIVNKDTPAYPGDPHIKIETTGTYDAVGYNDHLVSFDIHSAGTHIDAPWHMVDDGKTLDQMPIEQFVGRGVYIKVENGKFDLDIVKQAAVQAGDIVLFHTGMDSLFGQDEYYANHPAITEDIANYLIDQNIKMVGVDMCSPDNDPFPIHRLLLGQEILIIENLTNLGALADAGEFTVYALPLKLQLDGAPARVVAEIE